MLKSLKSILLDSANFCICIHCAIVCLSSIIFRRLIFMLLLLKKALKKEKKKNSEILLAFLFLGVFSVIFNTIWSQNYTSYRLFFH